MSKNKIETVSNTVSAVVIENKTLGTFRALIDTEDLPLVVHMRWNISGQGYAISDHKRKKVLLHRVVMGDPLECLDHINRDRLDNRKENLREATPSQNTANSKIRPSRSGFKGVRKVGKKYEAKINFKGKTTRLGMHPTAEDAARAYNEACRKIHGEFGVLNNV